jgi:nucleoside-diphosphate-sugar epimerase
VTRTLITGGAGFIGIHLARAMVARGRAVDLIDNFGRGRVDEDVSGLQRSGSVRLLEVDLREPGCLDHLDRDYEEVVHLAAVVGVAHVVRSPGRTLRDNVAMTDHVVAWAQGLPRLTRLLFASTSEVYAGTLQRFGLTVPTPEDVPLTVADVADPRSSYALSKVYGEALCHHAGVPFTIVRPHNVYGPRMGLSHVIPELLERAHAAGDGDSLEVHSLDHRRTFCFVEDAVEIVLRALESARCAGETLNVGSPGPEVSIGDVAAVVVETVGKPLEVRGLPPTPGSPARRCPDMTKTTRLTGWTASTALTAGVRRTYDWYRAHVFDGRGITVR